MVRVKDMSDNQRRGFFARLRARQQSFVIGRLQKQEERIEGKRERAQESLEDRQDILRERLKIATKKAEVKDIRVKQRQAIADEIRSEQNKLRVVNEQNRLAKEQLDKLTLTGKTKTALKRFGSATIRGVRIESQAAGRATKAFFQKESTRRVLDKIGQAGLKALKTKPIRRVKAKPKIRKTETREKTFSDFL